MILKRSLVVPKRSFRAPESKSNGLGRELSGRPRVLIVRRAGGIGDVLNCRMLFYDIKAQSEGRAEVHFAVPRDLVPLVSDHPYIDRAFPLDEVESVMARTKYGFIGDVTNACLRHETTFRGATHLQRSDVWAQHLGICLTRWDLDLRFTLEEVERARAALGPDDGRPLVLVCPTSAADSRDLPRHLVEETLAWGRERGYRLVMSATKDLFSDVFEERAVFDDLRTWMASFAVADGCVTTDTGALHAAGGTSCPTVAAFAYTSALVVPSRYPSVSGVQLHKLSGDGMACCPCYDWGTCPYFVPNEPKFPLKCLRDLKKSSWRSALDERIYRAVESSEDPPELRIARLVSRAPSPRGRPTPVRSSPPLKVDLSGLGLSETLLALEALEAKPVKGRGPDERGPKYVVATGFGALLDSYEAFSFEESFAGSPDVSEREIRAVVKKGELPKLRLPRGSCFSLSAGKAVCDRERMSPLGPSGERFDHVVPTSGPANVSLAVDVASSSVVVTGNQVLAELAVSLGIPCVVVSPADVDHPLAVSVQSEARARVVAWELAHRDRVFCLPGASDAIVLAARTDPSRAIVFSPRCEDGGPGVEELREACLSGSIRCQCPGDGSLASARELFPLWGGPSAKEATELQVPGDGLRVPDGPTAARVVDGVKPAWENWIEGRKCGWESVLAFHPVSRTKRRATESLSESQATAVVSAAIERGMRVVALGSRADAPVRYASQGDFFLDLVGSVPICEALAVAEKAEWRLFCPSVFAAWILTRPARTGRLAMWGNRSFGDDPRFYGFGLSGEADVVLSSVAEAENWLPYRIRQLPVERGLLRDPISFVFVAREGSEFPVLGSVDEVVCVVPPDVSIAVPEGVVVVCGKRSSRCAREEILSEVLAVVSERVVAGSGGRRWVWMSDGHDVVRESALVRGAFAALSSLTERDPSSRTVLATLRDSGALTPGARRHAVFGSGSGPCELIDPGSWGCSSKVFSAFVGTGKSFKQASLELFAKKLWKSCLGTFLFKSPKLPPEDVL